MFRLKSCFNFQQTHHIQTEQMPSLMPFSENKGNVNVGFTGEYAPKLKIEFYRSNESSQWDQEG